MKMEGLPYKRNTNKNNSNNISLITINQYLSRATDVSQMDFQAALDQMRNLLTLPMFSSLARGGSGNAVGPHGVFKMAFYRKQTKNHWARDDPAFCFLQVGFLLVACLVYCIAFRSLSISGILVFVVQSVLIHWLGFGIVAATIGKNITGKFMYYSTQGVSGQASSRHVKQSVEWLYAFDIHCNAFFPFFVITCKLYIVLIDSK